MLTLVPSDSLPIAFHKEGPRRPGGSGQGSKEIELLWSRPGGGGGGLKASPHFVGERTVYSLSTGGAWRGADIVQPLDYRYCICKGRTPAFWKRCTTKTVRALGLAPLPTTTTFYFKQQCLVNQSTFWRVVFLLLYLCLTIFLQYELQF
jgi:hypothetical protein